MRTKRSLIQIYLLSMIALAAVPVAIIGVIWIATEYESFTEQSANLRKTFVESRSGQLKREVGEAVDFVEYKRSQLDDRLRDELRQELAVALTLVANIHRDFAAAESEPQLRARVRKAIEPLRFHGNKGFYFALLSDGTALLPPLYPDTRERIGTGTVLSNFSRNVLAGDKHRELVEFDIGGARGGVQRNISFLYYYKPLDLYIGASVYRRDEIARIQQEVIERFSANVYDADSSVMFVTDASGKQLVNPFNPNMVGKLQPGMAQLAGILKDNPEGGGTTAEIEWLRPDSVSRVPGVTYVEYVPEWDWLIGSSFFLDKYYALLDAQRAALEARVLQHTLFIASVVLFLMILATLVARRLARLNARGFLRFRDFFAQASQRSTQIDVAELPFAEFEELAVHANHMVETRSQTERALKLSERRFQLALDASQSHLWDVDMKTDMIAVGAGFYRHLGYPPPPDAVPMQRFSNIFHPDDISIMREALNSADAPDNGINFEFRVRDNAGIYRWILSRGDIVESNPDGSPARAMGIMSDITDRKQMEDELVTARIAAEDANHAKSQFLSSASHELRTPLNGVLGYVQLLQRQKDLPKESQGYLDAIENCGQHLLNLINDVLDLAKVESGTVNLSLHTADVRDILSSVGDILRQRAQAKNLQYEHKVSARVPELIRTDEVKLRQILVNLLGNAVKFTDRGKVALEVDFDKERNALLFYVHDTGMGIPEDKLQGIFEPFRRVNEHDGKGTGLGLAICRRLVEAMGGELSVTSVFRKGTSFSFDLPLLSDSTSHVPERRKPVDTGEREAAVQHTVSDLSILIADDNADNRMVLEGMIKSIASTVYHASNGAEAIELLRKHPVDAVLMDYRMPEMDGIEATENIKHDEQLKDTVVIIVTASAGLDTQSQAFQAGCDAYLSKPVQMDELIGVISQHAGKPVNGNSAEAEANEKHALPDEPSAASNEPVLPEEDRKKLLELLELGDIAAMNTFCSQRAGGEHAAFIERAMEMLQNFDFQGLKDLLKESGR